MALEAAVSSLSSNLVAAVVEAWFSRRKPNQTLAQLLEDQVPSAVERRRLERIFEGMQDAVADRLMHEAPEWHLSENERQAAILTVSESFAAASLTQEDLLSASMSPAAIAEIVRTRSANVRKAAVLSDDGTQLYHALIGETSSILVTVVSSLPNWESRALVYLLRRQEDIGSNIADALDRLPSSRASDLTVDALASYRQSLVSALDRVETVGFPVSDAMGGLRLSETFVRPSVLSTKNRLPLDWALADHPRLFLSGPAGSGKTSILKWLAISSARRSLDGLLSSLNDLLPIYVPLRGAASHQGPVPTSSHLARIAFPSFESDQMVRMVQQSCEDGSALLLLDGLDEIDARARRLWLRWLSEMTERYPDNRFVVTSRSSPFGVESLLDQRFTTANLEAFDDRSKTQLIRQWFTAAASLNAWSETPPAESASRLTRIIASNRRLHDLAATPLMSTLMCALFRERGDLPLVGAEVYAEFIDMLVERRDTERGIAGIRELPKPEALMLLEQLARQMVLDGVTELSRSNAQAIVAEEALSLQRLQIDPDQALEHLLTRSGLLIEPASGRVQFVHLTFMEFLAARSFVENDDLGFLIKRAHDPGWHSVTVLAASQARPWQGEQLVEGMLERSRQEPRRRMAVAAVLQESVANMVRLRPSLKQECEAFWRQQTGTLTAHVVIGIDSGRAPELSSLYEWLAGDDEIQESGPILISRSYNAPEGNVLIVAGDQPPNMVKIIKSVLGWHRSSPRRDQGEIMIQGEGIRVAIFPSQIQR